MHLQASVFTGHCVRRVPLHVKRDMPALLILVVAAATYARRVVALEHMLTPAFLPKLHFSLGIRHPLIQKQTGISVANWLGFVLRQATGSREYLNG
jgi:hypothetical protein